MLNQLKLEVSLHNDWCEFIGTTSMHNMQVRNNNNDNYHCYSLANLLSLVVQNCTNFNIILLVF